MDFDLNTSIVNSNIDGNLVERFIDAYNELSDIEENMINVQKNISSLISEDIDACDLPLVSKKLSDISSQILSLRTNMISNLSEILSNNTSDDELIIANGLQNYEATKIILKKFQIVKLSLKKILLYIEKISAKISKKSLLLYLKGFGSNENSLLEVPIVALGNIANKINNIMSLIDNLLSLLNKSNLIGIKAGSATLFKTPKSLKNTEIEIKNNYNSVNHYIPENIDKSLTSIYDNMQQQNNTIKIKEISNCGQLGRNSSENGFFNFESNEKLKNFDGDYIKKERDKILFPLITAEALPRYEDLKFNNIKFLYYLVSGFLVGGKKSFGLPIN